MSTLSKIFRSTVKGSGGLRKLYAGRISDFTYTASGNTITGITMTAGKKFVEIQFEPQSSNIDLADKSTLRDNAFEVTGKFAIKGVDIVKHAALAALAEETIALIYQDQAGNYWFACDPDFGCSIGIGLKTGAKPSDENGYELSIKGYELPRLNYMVDSSVIATIV